MRLGIPILLAIIALGIGLGTGYAALSAHFELIAAIVGIGAVLALCLLNPIDGFLAWIIISPFGRYLSLNISLGHGIPDFSLDRLVTALLTVLILARLASGRQRLLTLTKVDITLALFLLFMGISLPAARMGLQSAILSITNIYLIPVLTYFIARHLITNRQSLERAMIVLMVIGAYLAFLVIREQITGEVLFYTVGRTVKYTKHLRRVAGLLGNPAFMAVCMAMVVPFSLQRLFHSRSIRTRASYLLLIGGLIVANFLCYSRGGWLGLIVGLLVMVPFSRRFRRFFVPFLLLSIVAVAVFWGPITSSYVVTERLTGEASVDFRLQMLQVARQMIMENPVLGKGYENFGYLYTRYAEWDPNAPTLPYPHNSYINIAVSAGLAGFMFYVGIFIMLAMQGLGLRRRLQKHDPNNPLAELIVAFWGALAAYVVTAATLDIMYSLFTNVLFLFIAGAVLAIEDWPEIKALPRPVPLLVEWLNRQRKERR